MVADSCQQLLILLCLCESVSVRQSALVSVSNLCVAIIVFVKIFENRNYGRSQRKKLRII